jgi:hypothetical protein
MWKKTNWERRENVPKKGTNTHNIWQKIMKGIKKTTYNKIAGKKERENNMQ